LVGGVAETVGVAACEFDDAVGAFAGGVGDDRTAATEEGVRAAAGNSGLNLAFEQPELFVDDVRTLFRKLRS